MTDLLLVVPDKTWKSVLDQILRRPEALGIRSIGWTIAVQLGDGAVRTKGPAVAATLSRLHRRAILILDHEGCGDMRSPEAIERDLQAKLRTHWADRADAVVVSPELEAWLWRARAQLCRVLDLKASQLADRLIALGFLSTSTYKPQRPKEAFHALLRETRKIPSAALYADIARRASLRREGCLTDSFPRLVSLLQRWFPPAPPTC